MWQDGRTAFCRGVEVDLEFDPEKFAGAGCYLMASVLSQMPAWRFIDPLPIYDAMSPDPLYNNDDEEALLV